MSKYTILEELTRISAPSGRETNIRNYIIDKIKYYVDELYIDVAGNIIAYKKSHDGLGASIGFLAHMDEIFLVVKKVENDKAFFCNMSKIQTNYLIGKKVKFLNGTFGIVQANAKTNGENINPDDLYIDISGNSTVQVGDFVTFVDNYMESENYIFSKSLDNRVGCYSLIQEIMKDKRHNNNIYYIFTIQEELGARGASNLLSNINLDYGFSIDVTTTQVKHNNYDLDINKGVALKVCDGGIISNQATLEKMIDLCNINNIKYQLEVLAFGSTDAATLNLYNSGIICGGISIPCRYVHSCNELVCMDDIEALIQLISLICDMNLNQNKRVIIKG